MRWIVLNIVVGLLSAQTAEHERARQLLASGHASEAAAIYRALSRAHSGNAELLLNLSIAEYKAGQYRQAAGSAADALRIASDLVPASLFLGASYLELGEFGKAVEALERVVTATPRDRNARLMLGDALLGAGHPDPAIEHFQASSEMLPDSPRVWYGLARAYDGTGEKKLAAEAWNRLMALPPSLESHLRAADLHVSALRWRDAAKEWEEARKLAPAKLNVRVGLAWALFRSGDHESALETLRPLLTTHQTPEVEFLYGASLLNMQQPAQAIPYLRAALARDARFIPARAALGQALLQIGKPEEAIPLLGESISADQDGSIHFQLFRAYQLTHRGADAQKALAAYHRLKSSISAGR